ncbi:putative HTH-type transcriptional regulator YdeC [Paenibacillus sp. J23TS9]|uniref:AraC family transcriptional regulator n=1 Tax=Paenibacillus sp. J23TS9 TaxID=2807193 RepID=UPI001B0E7FBD|nr:AraC family transcriptional regulator [Paenibacillus sp. J23TS9]GIP26339.1 putative HTH-type transcriptional regulator YdeC [Paenibacillus sp. J23TS9]
MQIKDFRIDQNLKERTEHRTVILPVACYETTITQNIHGHIPLHWHDEIQFVRIVKGEAVFQINEEKFILRQGEGIFINSGCLHMAEDRNESGCVYICLNVSPHFVVPRELYATHVAPYIQATNLSYLYLDSYQPWGKSILEAMMCIHDCIQRKPLNFEIDVSMHLTCMWKNLIMNCFQLTYDPSEAVKSERMKQMLSWIDIHYAEKITLNDIARAGQLSRSECCRYFKRILNTTPLNYVMDYRLQISLLLLQQDGSNVTEVAYKVGFNSTSYFIERFRKSMNMTPLAYKKSKMDA